MSRRLLMQCSAVQGNACEGESGTVGSSQGHEDAEVSDEGGI